MNKKQILVIGSSNTDMVVRSHKLPLPGETILGGDFLMNPGGKGANQAVAAARLGGKVQFMAKTGDDLFGRETRAILENENIETSLLLVEKGMSSGVALITVDSRGENCIVVAPGANASLLPTDLISARTALEKTDILLMQLEIPVETVLQAAVSAHKAGAMVILNPAPATSLPDILWQYLDTIVPNETEASLLTGIQVIDLPSAEVAGKALLHKGVSRVVITLGSKGALLMSEMETIHIPAPDVTAVDTTAAGDVFCGALAVSLAEETALPDAIRFAVKAASLSVTRAGAQASAPYRHEMN